MIHQTAIVDAGAIIGDNVSIGAYSVIGAGVSIGAGTVIGPHVVIDGPTTIGKNNRIFQFASVGADPQDKKFHGEHVTLEIGDGNTIREFTTINRGTGDGGGVTRIGNGNWIMAYVHIAHDCMVGSNTILANCASLAGHVHVGDHAILGGFSLIHQFCKIGAHAFTSMGSVINQDVPPYITVAGSFAKPKGINSEGLKRRGFPSDRIMAIKRAFKTLYTAGLPLAEARAQIAEQSQTIDELKLLVDFIDASERSLLR